MVTACVNFVKGQGIYGWGVCVWVSVVYGIIYKLHSNSTRTVHVHFYTTTLV